MAIGKQTEILKNSNVYIEEPNSSNISLDKSIFIFVIAAKYKEKKDFDGNPYLALDDDLITISEMVDLLLGEPFNVRANQIETFVNLKEADSVYSFLENKSKDPEIKNIFFFYQGFTIEDPDEFKLALRPINASELEGAKSLSIKRINDILIKRSDLNIIAFLDSSYSARALKLFDCHNYVFISSCSSMQESYIIKSKEVNKHVSVFTFSLIETLKNILVNEGGYINTNDLFLEIRKKMALLLKQENKFPTDQIPEIKTKNLTPYFRIIGENQEKKPGGFENLKDKYTFIELEELIANNKFEEVFTILKRSKVSEAYKMELILIQSKYSSYKGSRLLNLRGYNESDVDYSNIIFSLLQIIKNIQMDHDRIELY